MQKIPSLFKRNYDTDRLVYDEVVEGCEWVLTDEGVRATRKWDGTACLVQDGKLFKRYDAKKGKRPPPDFLPTETAPDPITGHWPGWVPVKDRPEDCWHNEAWQDSPLPNGTYELCGPHVNGNPEHFRYDALVPHGQHLLENFPKTFEEIRGYLATHDIEGIVFWHPDGRMAKIKARDFGIKRG